MPIVCIFFTLNPSEQGLSKFSDHFRVTVVKMMHWWLPANDKCMQQLQEETTFCPRCKAANETQDHVFLCNQPDAVKTREAAWCSFILTMKNTMATVPDIKDQWDRHRWFFLKLAPAQQRHWVTPPSAWMQMLINKAVREQNKIGWNIFIRGFCTVSWKEAQSAHVWQCPASKTRVMNALTGKLIHHILTFSLQCWVRKNEEVHGATLVDQLQWQCQYIKEEIQKIYNNPLDLIAWLSSPLGLPLESWLQLPIQTMQTWVCKVHHQVKVSIYERTHVLKQHWDTSISTCKNKASRIGAHNTTKSNTPL